MITGVSQWRCKCGVKIKIVTETDRARITEAITIEAVCPKCGERQTVYAHRIIKINVDPPEKYRQAFDSN